MTPEAQLIAIAEACGLEIAKEANPKDNPTAWKTSFFTPLAAKIRYKNWPSGGTVKIIPDYLHDLNAMHGAEGVLGQLRRGIYGSKLSRVLSSSVGNSGEYDIWHATAAQRAEAFLHTIGKWEE